MYKDEPKPLTPGMAEKRYAFFWKEVIEDGDNSIFMAAMRKNAKRVGVTPSSLVNKVHDAFHKPKEVILDDALYAASNGAEGGLIMEVGHES